MLYWSLVLLVLALVSAALGFGGLAGTFSWAAQLMFVVFLVLLVVSAAARALRGDTP